MSLKHLQETFKTAALRENSDAFTKAHLPYDPQESKERFSVYENNIIQSLRDVLGDTYPACKALVGDDFFYQTARDYIKSTPPQSPVLFEYGEGSIEIFKEMGLQHGSMYWGEVAAFEWAEHTCFFESDIEALSLQDLTNFDEEAFSDLIIHLSPAISLLKTKYNAQDIVNFANKEKLSDAAEFAVSEANDHYVFYRTEQKVVTEKISPFFFETLTFLKSPRSIEDLVSLFSQNKSDDEFPAFIQFLFSNGLACKITS